MIDSLEITNWKTHKKTSLKFQKGVNVLIGIMGAGKTSAIEAISFGLFGTFPALKSHLVTLDGLIMSRPSVEREASVRLGFSVDSDSYVVTRKFGDASVARLEKNGAHLQTQSTKVTEEVQNILKIDYDTFSRVVYAEQNRLDYFLEMTPGERKKEIDHMLGLDTFATAEENATSLVNSIKNAIGSDESSLQQFDPKEIRAQLKKLGEERDASVAEREKLAKQERELRADVEKTRKESELAKKQLTQRSALSDEMAKLDSRISTIGGEIKRIDSMKIDAEGVDERLKRQEALDRAALKELEDLRKRERELERKLSDAKSEYESNLKREKERDRLVKEIRDQDESDTKKRLDRAQADLQEIVKEIGLKRGKTAELDNQIMELDRHISVCPICERELSEEVKKRLLAGKRSAAESLGKEIAVSERSAAEMSSAIKRLTDSHTALVLTNKRLSEFMDLDEKIAAGKKACAELGKDAEAMQKGYEEKSRERNSIVEALARLRADKQTAERRKAYESEVMEATARLESKRKEFDSIKVDEKALYVMQERLTKQSSELSDVSSRLESGQKYLASIELQVKDKEKQAADYERIEKGIARRRAQVANLNKFKLALIDTEALLRNRLVSSINDMMQGLWPKLYPYGDYTSVRLNAKKDDYMLEVNTGEENWMPVDGIASGGERSIGCLAMRIALAMVVVPNLKWLILDEPTHNLDSTGISKLIDILGEVLPGVVEQIFIITHDDNLKQIASARVYQFDRDKGINAPTSVSVI
jgi:DNA repair protein SbcC/Rad50